MFIFTPGRTIILIVHN